MLHKADELKKLMEKYGIITMFLPHNMTQCLQPLDRVVCGLIKPVQRARRGRHLAAALKQWKDEQERIVGEARLNKRPHPPLAPWLPPKPTLLQGIFFYQKTHMEELQLENTKNAIRQDFIDTDITPFQDARWKEYRRERFTNHTKSATTQVLSSVLKLQDRNCKSAYLFRLGQWASMIKIPPSGRMPGCRILWFLELTLHRTAMRMQKTSLEEEEKKEEEEVIFTRENRGESA